MKNNMNLQENILRIQSMMGINESNLTSFKRRLDDLPKYIRSAYTWLNPKAFYDFDEYLNRVIFSTIRDYSTELGIGKNYEELETIREDIREYVKKYILDNFINEIREYYEKG